MQTSIKMLAAALQQQAEMQQTRTRLSGTEHVHKTEKLRLITAPTSGHSWSSRCRKSDTPTHTQQTGAPEANEDKPAKAIRQTGISVCLVQHGYIPCRSLANHGQWGSNLQYRQCRQRVRSLMCLSAWRLLSNPQ